MASKSFEYVVQGRVQGVNFRNWTVSQAVKLGITGFVKNEQSGDVSGYAEGSADALQRFAQLLQQGPGHADVDNVVIQSEQDVSQANYKSFDVRR